MLCDGVTMCEAPSDLSSNQPEIHWSRFSRFTPFDQHITPRLDSVMEIILSKSPDENKPADKTVGRKMAIYLNVYQTNLFQEEEC